MIDVDEILQNIKFDFLYIDVTAACNLQCKHCIFQINPSDLTEKLLTQDERKKMIDQAVLYGIRRILLSGKELFLVPETTLELLGYLSTTKEALRPVSQKLQRGEQAQDDNSFQFGFITNGTLVKEEHIERIPKNIGWIDVSMEGTKEYHERVRGAATFDKSMKTIDRFIAAGLPLSIAFTATSLNDRGIASGIEMFVSRGVRKLFISHYVPLQLHDPLRLSNQRLFVLVESLKSIAAKYPDIQILFELEAPQAVFLMEKGVWEESTILFREGREHEFYAALGKNLTVKWQRVYNFFMHDVRISPDGWVITCEEEHRSHYSHFMNREQSINIRDCDFDFMELERRIKTEKKIFRTYLEGIENHVCRKMPCFEYCFGGNQYARFVIDKQWARQSMNCEKKLI